MAALDKVIKFLQADNLVDQLDEQEQYKLVQDVLIGKKIDDDSRSEWLEVNQKAVEIVKNSDEAMWDASGKDFPFDGASKVIYPLIAPAGIQLSSRLIQHIVRNDKVAECAVLGPDPMGMLAAKAKRVGDFLSYETLIKSDTWLTDQHKLCTILSFWGTAFKRVYYDFITKSVCADIISPEDVIINNNCTCLDKCRRITIRNYLSKNDLIEKIRAGQFAEIDLDCLDSGNNDNYENDPQETDPVYEEYEQLRYLDLDDDGYEEPYIVHVLSKSEQLLGIYPAYELKDIEVNAKGQIKKISPCLYLVDYHLIDNPEGKFYSIGLNQLLYHHNKSLTSILRQLIDAGTLSNAASCSGWVTRAFKTKDREIRVRLGEFQTVDIGGQVNLQDQIMNLPFREPSQVLLALLELLIQSGKETGFITDILTGDSETQNVPATTMLAQIEQGTRAFKPLVQKLYAALKKEFKLWFHYHSLYLDKPEYFNFQKQQVQVIQDDFDEDVLDICPVADPTMCSEAHKYAKDQAMIQLIGTNAITSMNVPATLMKIYEDLDIANAQVLVNQQPPPNPQMMKIQVDAQLKQKDQQIQLLHHQLEMAKLELENSKILSKHSEIGLKAHEAGFNAMKTTVDAHKDALQLQNEQAQLKIEAYNAETERHRVATMAKQSANKDSSK